MDGFFVVVLSLGMGTSIVVLSWVVYAAYSLSEAQTFAFFFRLIDARRSSSGIN